MEAATWGTRPGVEAQEKTPETGTADNAGSREGKVGSFKEIVKMSPRHNRQRAETRKQYPRQEMTFRQLWGTAAGQSLKGVGHAPSS